MSKKILSVVLAIVLVFTVTATAFAASVSYEDEDAIYTQSWALGEPVDNGDGTWSVAVKLTANYPVMSFAFQLSNTDATNVTLKSAVVGKDIPNDETKETFWNATVKVNPAAGRVAINPNPIDDAVPAIDCSTEKEIAVLTYTVVDGKSADVAIVNDAKTATNGDGTLVAARSANNNVVTDVDNPIVGQKVSSVGSAVTLGSAKLEPADLAVADAYASSGIIIDTNKFASLGYAGVVYGFSDLPDGGATKTNEAYFTTRLVATNGGYLKVVKTPYVPRPVSYGTGTTVQVYNADDTLEKTYVIVIFGDVDGSGNITATDKTTVLKEMATAGKITEIQKMAANVVKQARGTAAVKAAYIYDLATADTTAITGDVASPGSKIKPVDMATEHNTYNVNYQ